jgi:hypothetical protein
MELAELAGIRGAASEKVKSFFSRTEDLIRLPYGRRIERRPRGFVLCGSTNSDTPFTDETGNRRYWPVKCGEINIEKLRADRDRLWAEAVVRFNKGEQWWLTDAVEELAARAQRACYEPGQWDEIITAWLTNPTQHHQEVWSEDKTCHLEPVEPFSSKKGEVTVTDVLLHAIGKPKDRWGQQDQNAVAKYLKSHRWELKSKRIGKTVIHVYRPMRKKKRGSNTTQ